MAARIQACQQPSLFPTKALRGHCNDGYCEDPLIPRLRCQPFLRLHTLPTKTSMLKKCERSCAPGDSLDFAMRACYDHHRQWWAPKSQTVMQCETYRLYPWGRCQERQCKLRCNSPCAPYQEPFCVNREPYRNDVNHIDIGIASPHLSSSARGYGRSCGGSFINC